MITTADKFNEKWKKYIPQGCNGLAIDHPETVKYLDRRMEELTKQYLTLEIHEIEMESGAARVHIENMGDSIMHVLLRDQMVVTINSFFPRK